MLTADISAPGANPHTASGRVAWRMTIRAWAPAARALPVATLSGALALAAAPALITLLRGGTDLSGALVAATIIGAPSVALAVEDPAAETLSASPTALARRRSLGLSTIVLALGLVWAGIVLAASTSADFTGHELGQRAAEAAAVAGLSAAASGLGHRSGIASSGPIGAVSGALSVLLISSLAFRFHQLPSLMTEQAHERWWAVAAVGWLVTAWTWRDPAR